MRPNFFLEGRGLPKKSGLGRKNARRGTMSRRGNPGPPARFDPIEDRQRHRLRVQPPKALNKDEVAEWFKIVNAAPADWFSDSNTGALEQYCRHVVAARRIATSRRKIRGARPELRIVLLGEICKVARLGLDGRGCR
jgi:hypothetical protein